MDTFFEENIFTKQARKLQDDKTRWQDDNMTGWQDDNMTRWQDAKMTRCHSTWQSEHCVLYRVQCTLSFHFLGSLCLEYITGADKSTSRRQKRNSSWTFRWIIHREYFDTFNFWYFSGEYFDTFNFQYFQWLDILQYSQHLDIFKYF